MNSLSNPCWSPCSKSARAQLRTLIVKLEEQAKNLGDAILVTLRETEQHRSEAQRYITQLQVRTMLVVGAVVGVVVVVVLLVGVVVVLVLVLVLVLVVLLLLLVLLVLVLLLLTLSLLLQSFGCQSIVPRFRQRMLFRCVMLLLVLLLLLLLLIHRSQHPPLRDQGGGAARYIHIRIPAVT